MRQATYNRPSLLPTLRPLEDSPDDVEFPIDRRVRPSRRLAFADVADNLRRNYAPYRNFAQYFVDGFHTLPFGLNAARRKMWNPIREELLRRVGEREPGEVVFSGSEFARFGLSELTPVPCAELRASR